MIALLAEDVALRDGIFAATREAEGESTEEEQQRILNSQATGCRVKAEDHGTMRHKDRHKHVADDDSRAARVHRPTRMKAAPTSSAKRQP